jgi:nucleolar protein 12
VDEDSKEKNMNREKRRAAAWRAEQDKLESGDQAEIESADKAKSFIDAKGKRKVAFIKKDVSRLSILVTRFADLQFHSELDACNAYIVFAHPHPDRPTNVAPVMNPFEAAKKALAANGTSFLTRTIRVDTLRLPSALSKRDAWLPSNADPKKSLFVGGLDYAAKEEDVRVLFEELVKAERGASVDRYVTGVRIIRDAATQLGKGFGYIHFKVRYLLSPKARADKQDRESVEELLAMDEGKFRFAKRKLRVQPCKTLPLGARTTPAQAAAQKTKTAPKGPAPKGNPQLGDAIKDLSKEERKVYKSTDAERQARRLAKKKMKAGFEQDRNTGAVKLDTGRSKDKHVKPTAKKSRARNAAAVSKMKGSRA